MLGREINLERSQKNQKIKIRQYNNKRYKNYFKIILKLFFNGSFIHFNLNL